MISLFLALVPTLVVSWEDIILTPPSGKTGPESVLYFGQGADLKTSQYTKILSSLQQAVDFPLWVGIPQCPQNVSFHPVMSNSHDYW
jgi:hypothetical protein